MLLLLVLPGAADAAEEARLKNGDEGTDRVGELAVGDDEERVGRTSGRSSHRCLDESKTLRFLPVATLTQTLRCLSSDSGLKVRKQIGQGKRINGPGG